MKVRRYRSPDRDAVIGLFRDFMRELMPPSLATEFATYVDTAIREELSRIEDYYAHGAFWVAEDGQVVGMVGVERHTEDSAELRQAVIGWCVRKTRPPRRTRR